MKQTLISFLFRIFAFFARVYLKRCKSIVIGVTGSVGKTSCRTIVSRVLQVFLPEKTIYTSPKNYNSEIGLTLSIFQIESYSRSIPAIIRLFFSLLFLAFFGKKKSDILVLEYGIDHPGDMDFLLKIAIPDYAIFTQLDVIHAENFVNKEAVGVEKMKLLHAAKKGVFLNDSDPFQHEYAPQLSTQVHWFHTDNLQLTYIQENTEVLSQIIRGNTTLTTNLLGRENAMYMDLALGLLDTVFEHTIPIETTPTIEFQIQPGRFSLLKGKKDSVIIDSSYNAGPQSMHAMIQNTLQLQHDIFQDYTVLFVLGDMREIGKDSEKVHKELYDFAKEKGEIISVGRQTGNYFGKHLGNFKYAEQAGQFLLKYLKESPEKYVILFKGSQNTIFLEEAIKEVLKYKKDKQQLVRQESYWKKKEF